MAEFRCVAIESAKLIYGLIPNLLLKWFLNIAGMINFASISFIVESIRDSNIP